MRIVQLTIAIGASLGFTQCKDQGTNEGEALCPACRVNVAVGNLSHSLIGHNANALLVGAADSNGEFRMTEAVMPLGFATNTLVEILREAVAQAPADPITCARSGSGVALLVEPSESAPVRVKSYSKFVVHGQRLVINDDSHAVGMGSASVDLGELIVSVRERQQTVGAASPERYPSTFYPNLRKRWSLAKAHRKSGGFHRSRSGEVAWL